MSCHNAKVSIVTPVYNTGAYIGECLDSLLKQTYSNIELIVVNDGSKDDSAHIIDEYASKDSRIIAIHQPNGGVARARNTGVSAATGDYLMFVDSDDYVADNFVEVLLECLYRSDADIAFCNYFSVYKNACVEGTRIGKFQSETLMSQEDYLEHFYTYTGSYAILWNKIFKMDIFDGIKFKEGIQNEDAEVLPSLIRRAKKIVLIPQGLYYYRQRNSSITKEKSERMLLNEMSWIEGHMAIYREENNDHLLYIAQKLYINKIVSYLHFVYGKTRKDIRQKLNKELKVFVKNSPFSMKVKLKYIIASLLPYSYGRLEMLKNSPRGNYWD